MFRSSVIGAQLIFALFIVSSGQSAPREDVIPRRLIEFHKTRETEFLEESSRHLRNEIIDISRGDESLPRLTRVAKEPPPRTNDNENKTFGTIESSTDENTNDKSRLNVEKSEIEDMLDYDTTNNRAKTLSMAAKNATTEEKYTPISTASKLPPMIFPGEDTGLDVRIATTEWLEDLKKTSYTTDETENNGTAVGKTGSSADSVIDVVTISSMTNGPTKVPPLIVESSTRVPTTANPTTITQRTTVRSSSTKSETITDSPTTTTDRPTSSSPSPDELKLHEKKMPVPSSMPSGVVALITAIGFAIVAVVAYIGLLVRRRYVEWRYGNRELLVNDFDAVDIGNFEL